MVKSEREYISEFVRLPTAQHISLINFDAVINSPISWHDS